MPPRGDALQITGQGGRWGSSEQIDRYMHSGLSQAMQDAQISTPTITGVEVHKLDRAN